MGSPPVHGKIVCFRLHPTIRKRVDELAREKRLTRSEILHRLIRRGLAAN